MSAVATFKITIAYDGSEFVGWQRQANGVSIQGLIENALADLDGAPVAVAGAGRTDAGVHALGQVASFSLARAIDARTRGSRAERDSAPVDSRRWRPTEVASSFHARFAARSKTYRYRICDRRGDAIRSSARTPGIYRVVSTSTRCGAPQRSSKGRTTLRRFKPAGGDVRNTEREVIVSRSRTRRIHRGHGHEPRARTRLLGVFRP